MAKSKNKKAGFLKRQKEKLVRKRRQRKKTLKNVISPMKHLKSLSAEEIKHYLEDAPFLLEEKEFDEFSFSAETVIKSTNTVLERYQELFAKAETKKPSKKRKVYEDFCVETVGKLVNKAFLITVQRRLQSCSKRLKDEGNTQQMMRAIVTEATLNIPQIPVEAHPFIVGMYEKVRLTAMPDFSIPGFEQVMSWQDRVALEREEEKIVTGVVDEESEVISLLEADSRFKKKKIDKGVAFRWMRPSDEDDSEKVTMVEAGLLTIVDGSLELRTESYTFADEARDLLRELLGDRLSDPKDEDETVEAVPEGDSEEGDAAEPAQPESSVEEPAQSKQNAAKKKKKRKETK